jgi:hypothetical protein
LLSLLWLTIALDQVCCAAAKKTYVMIIFPVCLLLVTATYICFIVTLAYRFVEMSCSPVDIYFKYLVLHHGYILLTKHINNKNKKHTVASIKKDHKAK